jgi:hypothetical protein
MLMATVVLKAGIPFLSPNLSDRIQPPDERQKTTARQNESD